MHWEPQRLFPISLHCERRSYMMVANFQGIILTSEFGPLGPIFVSGRATSLNDLLPIQVSLPWSQPLNYRWGCSMGPTIQVFSDPGSQTFSVSAFVGANGAQFLMIHQVISTHSKQLAAPLLLTLQNSQTDAEPALTVKLSSLKGDAGAMAAD